VVPNEVSFMKIRNSEASLGLLDQGLQRLGRNPERATGEAINVRGIHPNHFSAGVEDRAATGAVCGGCVID
jgi:hypothetical protein